AQEREIDVVVNMEVDDAEVVKRLTGRWYCPTDGQVYHELFNPPAKAGRCNGCGGELVRRKDDERSVVEERLRTYHAETRPLIAYYEGCGILRSVRGTDS